MPPTTEFCISLQRKRSGDDSNSIPVEQLSKKQSLKEAPWQFSDIVGAASFVSRNETE